MDDYLYLFGRDQEIVRFVFSGPFRNVPRGFGDRPGVIAFRHRVAEGGSDPDQIRRQDVKADLGLVAARNRYSIAVRGVARHWFYGGEAVEVDGHSERAKRSQVEGG